MVERKYVVLVEEENLSYGDDISYNNKNNQAKKKEADSSAMMLDFNDILDCKSTADIFYKVLCAISAIESSYRRKEWSSALCKRKAKYLLGRFYEKYDPSYKKYISEGVSDNNQFIGSNTLVSIKIKLKSSRKNQMISKD